MANDELRGLRGPHTLTRRRFVALLAAFAASATLPPACRSGDDNDKSKSSPTTQAATGSPTVSTQAGVSVEQFLTMSKLLTAFDTLSNTTAATLYLNALAANGNLGSRLDDLWQQGGFGSSSPPASVADLQSEGVYDDKELAMLADTITNYWYSGEYDDANGDTHVATYIDALAWQALGYRPQGPTTCGGAFGHWADAPQPAQ